MSIHRIGDMVKVDCPKSPRNGWVCVVTSELMDGWRHEGDCIREGAFHKVSFPKLKGRGPAYLPDELIPISRLTVDELAEELSRTSAPADAKEVA